MTQGPSCHWVTSPKATPQCLRVQEDTATTRGQQLTEGPGDTVPTPPRPRLAAQSCPVHELPDASPLQVSAGLRQLLFLTTQASEDVPVREVGRGPRAVAGAEGTGHRAQPGVAPEAAAEELLRGRAETRDGTGDGEAGRPVTRSPGEKTGARDASGQSQGTDDGNEDYRPRTVAGEHNGREGLREGELGRAAHVEGQQLGAGKWVSRREWGQCQVLQRAVEMN